MRPLTDLSLFDAELAQMLPGVPAVSNGGTPPRREIRHIRKPLLDNQFLYCRYCGHSVLQEHFFQRRRNPDFLSVEYVVEGEIRLRSGRTALVAEPGDLIFLQPGRNNDLLYRPGRPCVKYGLIFGGRGLGEILRLVRLDRVLHLEFRERLEPVGFFERFAGELTVAETDPAARDRLAGLTFEFFQFLSNRAAVPVASAAAENMRRFLDENYFNPLTVDRLAAEFKMSRPAVYKVFQAAFKRTPHEYLARFRLERAAELLAQSSLRVKEVAARVGYNAPEHFTAEFRKVYGVSPRAFRQARGETP